MRYLLLLLILIQSFSGYSQNGKILQKVAYTLSDSTRGKVEQLVPDLKSITAQVDFYHIFYESDGLKVKGYMAVPKKKGKYPCIIYNRGGNREFGKVDDSGFVVRGLGDLSRAGYVVVASQYRGNDGGEGKEEFGGKDVNDVLNLIPLLANVPEADTSRIGMFGWSRGGMMTYLALTKTKRIKAAVVGGGATDLLKGLEARPGMEAAVMNQLIPDYTANKTEALKQRSAVYFAEKINKSTPILIIQGSADWRTPTDQVLDLVSKFYQLKHPFRFILYEGGQHSLIEYRSDYIQQMINWFNTYLRDGKKWPSIEPHGE
jgi:dipeptidyl aminopeptidase/acylaminoacyl peptidase